MILRVSSICQVPHLSQECAQMSPISDSSLAFMSGLWPGITNLSFMQSVIMNRVIFTILLAAAVKKNHRNLSRN